MYVDRVQKIANGRHVIRRKAKNVRAKVKAVKARKTHRPRVVANPAHMLTLGFLNPKKGSKMAKTKKRRVKAKNVRRAVNRSRAHNRKHNRRHNRRTPMMMNRRRNAPRVVVIRHNRKKHNSRRNPFLFGANVPVTKLAEYIAGGLIGMAVNKAILPMLPTTLTSNNFAATATAVVLAVAEWWGASMFDKDFGSAVGFGALMHAGGIALNTWLPTVGTYNGISGRGVADFVPGRFAVPQNPVLDANGGMIAGGGGQQVAYPAAYRVAA